MNIYLEIFLTFLKIGVVSFGGGYGMISILKEEVVKHGWMSVEEFSDFVAVSESTPGPIAINMATFVGSSQGNFFGALLATIGVILPAFIIMLAIVMILKNFLKYKGVDAFLKGIRPCVIGLILSTGLLLVLSALTGIKTVNSTFVFDWRNIVIFASIVLISIIYKKISKKNISPILLILISAVFGIVMFA